MGARERGEGAGLTVAGRERIALVRRYMAAGDWPRALRLAAKLPNLGAEKALITRGWAAFSHPDFYLAMSLNPEAIVAEGVAALKRRFRTPQVQGE